VPAERPLTDWLPFAAGDAEVAEFGKPGHLGFAETDAVGQDRFRFAAAVRQFSRRGIGMNLAGAKLLERSPVEIAWIHWPAVDNDNLHDAGILVEGGGTGAEFRIQNSESRIQNPGDGI
jgi:hypothetical protein